MQAHVKVQNKFNVQIKNETNNTYIIVNFTILTVFF